MVKAIVRNLKKDVLVEWRNRFAFNVSLAFAGISTLSVSLIAAGISLPPKIHAVILWLIFFFSAMGGLSHIFIREEDQGTALFLRLHSSPDTIYLSKLLFNLIFFFAIQMVIAPLYVFFLQVDVRWIPEFIIAIAAGGIAIVSSSTILAAMISRAGGRGSLFTVVSFPVLLPVLWISVSETAAALERTEPDRGGSLFFLLAFSGMMIAISLLLFPKIWVEE